MRASVSGEPNSCGLHSIQFCQRIEAAATNFATHARRVFDKQDRIAGRPALYALIHARQVCVSPHAFPAVRRVAARDKDHKGGQVLIDRPQSVSCPRAERSTAARKLAARVHQKLGRRMIELFGRHRPDDRQVVRNSCQMRHKRGKPCSVLPVLSKAVHRAEQLRHAFDKCKPLALKKLVWAGLPVPLHEFRLVIEELQMRRSTCHVQEDDLFGLRREISAAGWQADSAAQLVQQSRARRATSPARCHPARRDTSAESVVRVIPCKKSYCGVMRCVWLRRSFRQCLVKIQ